MDVTTLQLTEMLAADLVDYLNERYAYYEVDTNQEHDSEWLNIALKALRIAAGAYSEATGEDEPSNPNTGAPYYNDYKDYI